MDLGQQFPPVQRECILLPVTLFAGIADTHEGTDASSVQAERNSASFQPEASRSRT